jgi:hypothetical protein
MSKWLSKQRTLAGCAVRLVAAVLTRNQAAFDAVRADIESAHE